MTLSAMQRMDLADQLSDLMEQQATAKGLERMTLAEQIADVMIQLGFGGAGTQSEPTPPAAPDPVPPPQVPETEPTLPPEPTPPAPSAPTPETSATTPTPDPGAKPETGLAKADDVPQVVTDFLAGKHDEDKPPAMVSALQSIQQYVGKFMTFDQVAGQCATWLAKTGFTIDSIAA